MRGFGIIVLIVISMIIGPAIFIWGANELLEQAGVSNQIPWNFWTWLAALAVTGIVRVSKT